LPDARAAVEALPIAAEAKALVVSENLRHLTDRFLSVRWRMLQQSAQLRFPRLPESPEDVAAQGFAIVAPGEMPPAEFTEARAFWSNYGIRSFYQDYKPWAHYLVQLVRDLRPRSVLEFGANVGRNLYAIRAAFPDLELVGLDINEEAAACGRREAGLDLRVGDESTLCDFEPGRFDLIFTVSVLDHIADIGGVCAALLNCAARYLCLLEVTLPVEGKVVQHFDHKHGAVRPSTGASYSWQVDRFLRGAPRVRRLDCRPMYLHSAALGPYYWSYLAFLDVPGADSAPDARATSPS
jgi:SAM-dependent methyltransferase